MCNDITLMAMALARECRGRDGRTDVLSHWQEHRDLLARILTLSKRRHNLMLALNVVRPSVLHYIVVTQDCECSELLTRDSVENG